jgi:hypothetical protein
MAIISENENENGVSGNIIGGSSGASAASRLASASLMAHERVWHQRKAEGGVSRKS